jgi:hypothetical protein
MGCVLLSLHLLHNNSKAEVHPGHKLTGPKEEEEEKVYIFVAAIAM